MLVRGPPRCCIHTSITLSHHSVGAKSIAVDMKSCSSCSVGVGRIMDGKSQFTEREKQGKKRREKSMFRIEMTSYHHYYIISPTL